MKITKLHIAIAVALLAVLLHGFLFYRIEHRLDQQETAILQIVNFINQQIQAAQKEQAQMGMPPSVPPTYVPQTEVPPTEAPF